MKPKKIFNFLKVAGLIYLLNLAENILLLLLFGIEISVSTIVGAVVFTLALSLLLHFCKLIRKEEE